MAEKARIPPGQGVTKGWPVLHVGPVPELDTAAWTLRVHGAVERPLSLTWGELEACERCSPRTDFHCVTGWSRLGVEWEGVRLAVLLARARPTAAARFVRFADAGRYDTTVPLALALADEAFLADRADGRPLERIHGGPLRAVVPSLYAWKSCKWVREVELLTEERLGFWEARGYANGADPWREERLI
jgi:DMSO/TMAO reductase YedYZ molybdopterin-dependent catalytic subunit